MSDAKPWQMGMRLWHIHDWASGGLRICAGPGDVCKFADVVAERPTCHVCKGRTDTVEDNPHPHVCRSCGGGSRSDARKRKLLDHRRFERIVESVNGCAGIPDPSGVPAMLDFVWGMAHDEEHEGHEAAKQALYEMGFFRDEEQVADAVMGEEESA